jgi:multidrug efflux pump subunit AcrA (membrane-fusion protein)
MRSHRWVNIALVAVILTGSVAAYLALRPAGASEESTTTARTVQVTRGTVATTVSAQGNIEAATNQTLTFGQSGKVGKVLVQVGDQVASGDTLAALTSEQADDAVAQATKSLTKAKRVVTQAETQVKAATQSQTGANQSITTAKKELKAAKTNLSSAKKALTKAKKAAKTSGTSNTSSPASPTSPSSSASSTDAVSAAQAAVEQAEAQVSQATSALSNAESQKTNAAGQVVAADAGLADAKDAETEAAEALADAEAEAADLSLVAPFAGVVTAVGIAEGDEVSGGSASPDASGAQGAQGTSNTSNTSSTSSGIELASLETYQVSGDFAEADAASLAVGQRATIEFPAVPDVTASGTVSWISPIGSVSSSVVTYSATVTLDEVPADVRLSQTATITVATAEATNVLLLPLSAVAIADAATGTVELVTSDGSPPATATTTVELGLQGDSTVEVVSGVAEGDQVLISLDTSTGLTSGQNFGFGSMGGAMRLGTGSGPAMMGGGMMPPGGRQ